MGLKPKKKKTNFAVIVRPSRANVIYSQNTLSIFSFSGVQSRSKNFFFHFIVCPLFSFGEIRILSHPAFFCQPTFFLLTIILNICLFLHLGHCYHRNAVFTLWLAMHNNRITYNVWLYYLWCTSGTFRTK